MKRNHIALAIIGLIILVGAGMLATPKQETPKETVRIGALLPLTGNFAYFGEDVKNGMELAKKKLNEEGLNIEIVYEDSAADTKVALPAARKLIDIERTEIVFGGPGSSANIAVAPLMQESQTIFLPISNSPKLNDAGEYIFKLEPDIDIEVKKMASYIISKDVKAVATLFDSSSDTQLIGKELFEELYDGKFGKVAISEGFDGKGSLDYRTQVTRIMEKNPEAIYLFANQKQGGAAVKQLRVLGYEGDIFGWSALNGQEFFDGAKESAKGVLITDQLFSCEGNDQMKEYCAEYMDAYKDTAPIKYGVSAYDTMLIIGEAIKENDGRMDERTKSAIQAALKDETYDGVGGKTYFDTEGNVTEKEFEFRVAEGEGFRKMEK